ncbi:DUF5315 domain-containing protein Ecym_7040 [Eremothecium cymbalariae DBVPG|uniref:Uncharacterized protein n=1 Tax=Eremothecium cymbalariae (strain CBS 270.75 / DBVPG 7215 / KCTC 17166 / NRRL Y-17582) TaxID=931890 RepID=G8JVN1_ERECY|nr:hypothetical protein Ecym_7040 [Eremothecium cymbalariae DBVPG\
MSYSQESLSVESADNQATRSQNTVRTLPVTVDGTENAKPIVDYKDKLWTEIDVLDDVKRMAEDRKLFNGFPEGFESHLENIRKSHATLLNALKNTSADNLEEQQAQIVAVMKQTETFRDK